MNKKQLQQEKDLIFYKSNLQQYLKECSKVDLTILITSLTALALWFVLIATRLIHFDGIERFIASFSIMCFSMCILTELITFIFNARLLENLLVEKNSDNNSNQLSRLDIFNRGFFFFAMYSLVVFMLMGIN